MLMYYMRERFLCSNKQNKFVNHGPSGAMPRIQAQQPLLRRNCLSAVAWLHLIVDFASHGRHGNDEQEIRDRYLSTSQSLCCYAASSTQRLFGRFTPSASWKRKNCHVRDERACSVHIRNGTVPHDNSRTHYNVFSCHSSCALCTWLTRQRGSRMTVFKILEAVIVVTDTH